MTFGELLDPELIFANVKVSNRDELFKLVAIGLASKAKAEEEMVFEELCRREAVGSTGIGGGVAIPHCKVKGLKRTFLAVVTTEEGLDFEAADKAPVALFLVLASPVQGQGEHLKALALISEWLKSSDRPSELKGLDQAALVGAMERGAA